MVESQRRELNIHIVQHMGPSHRLQVEMVRRKQRVLQRELEYGDLSEKVLPSLAML